MNELKELMSRDVKVVSPGVSIREAASQMLEGDFGMMPVGDAHAMVGTISDRDIVIRAVARGLGLDTKVRDVMSKGVSSVFETDTVEQAVKIMGEKQVRRLPVVNQDKKLVGIVSLGDLAVKDSLNQPAGKALSEISEPS